MAVQTNAHPTSETLAAFNCGSLPDDEREAVESHISSCDVCCAKLAMLSEDRLAGLARQAGVGMPATSAMVDVSDAPPELVGHERYQIISQIGVGGMGVVYKAEDRFMGRTVALKTVARRYTANASALERFRREVRAAAKLNHQNIVTAHDTGEANGLHFLIMEFVDGISLDRLVQKKGPLPIATACQCIRQAAHGLQHAFEQHMVHRDIKPHNLMVTRKGQIKVLDFGLARVAAEADLPPLPGGTPHPDRTVTSPSLVMGTPDYLAPEQARNAHSVDIRADIYALGCVFYYLLAAKPPFARLGTALEKMLAHVQDAPEPLRTLRPEVPTEIADIVTRMMAKNPAERFATPAEVASAIKPFTRAEAIIDDAPEIIDTRTEPMVEVPTKPIAAAETDAAPRPVAKRRKINKRSKRRLIWPFVAAGSAAALITGVIGLIIALGGDGRDRGTQQNGRGGTGDALGGAVAGKRVLFVVPNQGLHFADYDPVKKRLEANGIEVVTASSSTNECRLNPLADVSVRPERTVNEINTREFAAVLFCGANVEEFVGNPMSVHYKAVDRIIQEMTRDKKPIGAICVGQKVLNKFLNVRPRFEGVSSNDGIVVAGKPEDAIPFADAILVAIKK
jgi:serine/threonine-protein kinase